MEEDLRTKIGSDAAVKALVATASIAWGDRPQGSALPAITLDIIAGTEAQHMTGVQDLQSVDVQCDIWDIDRLKARDIRKLVIAAVLPAAIVGQTSFRRSFVVRRNASFDETDAKDIVYRESIDFRVWHAPSN